MGRFSGLANISTNRGGIYFEPGEYVVALGQIKVIDGYTGTSFVVETEVKESTNPTRGPGSTPSTAINISDPKRRDMGLADVKAFSAAVLGINDPDGYNETPRPGETQEAANDRFWEEAIEALASPQQPAKGMLMRVSAQQTVSQKTGKAFTRLFWRAYEAQEA